MIKMIPAICLFCVSALANACIELPLTVEESRLSEAEKALPKITSQFDQHVNSFKKHYSAIKNYKSARAMVREYAHSLWQKSVKDMQSSPSSFDDRALYWARLKMTAALHVSDTAFKPTTEQLKQLTAIIEEASRGHQDISFSNQSDIKILITGFDPFLLDQNIKQSNPSGVAALFLDNKTLTYGNTTIEIQAAMFPVRYGDFDQGVVEKVVKPYLKNNSIDLLATISMGRQEFDLEHFPGKRRSVLVPDNNNEMSGGSPDKPIIPKLGKTTLEGPEFVEFTLPYEKMMVVNSPFKVNDNRTVVTLEKRLSAENIEQLQGQTAVEGGGGGYLSNEISYRTINLGNKLETNVPTGHIHTPRVQEFDRDVIKAIVGQIKGMLINAVTETGT